MLGDATWGRALLYRCLRGCPLHHGRPGKYRLAHAAGALVQHRKLVWPVVLLLLHGRGGAHNSPGLLGRARNLIAVGAELVFFSHGRVWLRIWRAPLSLAQLRGHCVVFWRARAFGCGTALKRRAPGTLCRAICALWCALDWRFTGGWLRRKRGSFGGRRTESAKTEAKGCLD